MMRSKDQIKRSPPPLLVRSSVLHSLLQFTLPMDMDVLRLMTQAGISRHYLDDPELMVPMGSVVRLYELFARASGLEDFGIRFAEMRGLPDLGPIILMLREEPDVRTALKNLSRALHNHSDALVIFLDDGGEADPVLIVDILHRDGESNRQAIDASVAGTVAILRWLLGQDWVPELVSFQHDRPGSIISYNRYFRAPLQFSADVNGVVLRAEDLDQPLRSTAPAIRRHISQLIENLSLQPSNAVQSRSLRIISTLMARGDATAPNTARLLGISTRTLHRRLADESTSFSLLLDEQRRNHVVAYLKNKDLSLTDISSRLGFGSLSAFSRWFTKTYDRSPTNFRKDAIRSRD